MAERRPAHETLFHAFELVAFRYNEAPSFPSRTELRLLVSLFKTTVFPQNCLPQLLPSVRGVKSAMISARGVKLETPTIARLRVELDQLVDEVVTDLEARLDP